LGSIFSVLDQNRASSNPCFHQNRAITEHVASITVPTSNTELQSKGDEGTQFYSCVSESVSEPDSVLDCSFLILLLRPSRAGRGPEHLAVTLVLHGLFYLLDLNCPSLRKYSSVFFFQQGKKNQSIICIRNCSCSDLFLFLFLSFVVGSPLHSRRRQFLLRLRLGRHAPLRLWLPPRKPGLGIP
jgi:hypothetical protein